MTTRGDDAGTRGAASGGAPPRPRPVETAFLLWAAALGLYLIQSLLAVLVPPSAEDYAPYLENLGLPATPEVLAQVEASQNSGASVGAMVFTVVVVALGAWFGLRMRAGANWARITITVLAALGVLGMLVTLLLATAADAPQAGGVLTPILQVITLVLLVGFLVVAFRRPANQYFASTPRTR